MASILFRGRWVTRTVSPACSWALEVMFHRFAVMRFPSASLIFTFCSFLSVVISPLEEIRMWQSLYYEIRNIIYVILKNLWGDIWFIGRHCFHGIDITDFQCYMQVVGQNLLFQPQIYVLTHCPLGNVAMILKVWLSNSSYRILLWTLKNSSHLFVQALIKENIKALHHWPLWGETTGNWWIPLTKGQ